MLCRVALVRTDVSEERIVSIIRMTRIGELGTLARRFLSPWWWRRYVLPKRRFLQEPHGVTSLKTGILQIHRREHLEFYIMILNLFISYVPPAILLHSTHARTHTLTYTRTQGAQVLILSGAFSCSPRGYVDVTALLVMTPWMVHFKKTWATTSKASVIRVGGYPFWRHACFSAIVNHLSFERQSVRKGTK
jgi:hypothetical protein